MNEISENRRIKQIKSTINNILTKKNKTELICQCILKKITKKYEKYVKKSIWKSENGEANSLIEKGKKCIRKENIACFAAEFAAGLNALILECLF